jgi:type IV pilus biogenesis/stability protein PilW
VEVPVRTWSVLFCLPLVLTACISEKRMQRAQAEVDLGVAYYREGNTEDAIAKLREATHTDPRNWRAWNALAITYAAKGQGDLAGEAFRKALAIDGKEGEILVNYGAWQVTEGHPDEAVATLELALADLDYRNTAMVLSNLSYALLQAGRPEDAIARARDAVKRMPTLCQGWFHLGLAEEKAGDEDAALAAYDTLIHTCPNDSVGARLRTGCLQVHGPAPELGIDMLQTVVEDVPDTRLADEARTCLKTVGR